MAQTEAKNKLSALLARVKAGETVVITERGIPVARIEPAASGAAEDDEMSGQMITRGWRIRLEAQGQTYEYRADKNQLRAYKFKGKNYRI